MTVWELESRPGQLPGQRLPIRGLLFKFLPALQPFFLLLVFLLLTRSLSTTHSKMRKETREFISSEPKHAWRLNWLSTLKGRTKMKICIIQPNQTSGNLMLDEPVVEGLVGSVPLPELSRVFLFSF